MASRSERLGCAARRQQPGEGPGWALGESGEGPAGGSDERLSTGGRCRAALLVL